MITEKNIFDATRSPRAARAPRPAPRPARSETVALVGTLSYAKGQYAFFEGSSLSLTKVLTNGQRIAGYTLANIARGGVELTAGTNKISLAVGAKLQKEGDSWKATGGSLPSVEVDPGAEASPGSPTSAASEENAILLRLKRQREEQLK